jgi:hypothetical protein
MRVTTLYLSFVLAAGCSGATVVGGDSGGDNTGSTSTGTGDSGGEFDEIGEVTCVFSSGHCLNIPGRVIGANSDDGMAVVGAYLGSDPNNLSNEVFESAAIGWAELPTSDPDYLYDIGHATSARVEGDVVTFEFPLHSVDITCDPDLECGATSLPDGYYRLSARVVLDPSDFDFDGFDNGEPRLQVAYSDDLGSWGYTDGDVGDWVWEGIDPEGSSVSHIVIQLRSGRYKVVWFV